MPEVGCLTTVMEGFFLKNMKSTLLRHNLIPLFSHSFRKCSVFYQYNIPNLSKYILNDLKELPHGSHNRLNTRFLHINSVSNFRKRDKEDRKTLLSDVKGEGTEGEKSIDIDTSIRGFGDIFPDENTPSLIYDGVKFSDLPIVNVKVSRNNTIISIADAKGFTKLKRSCGMDGFKNTKKGTNVAAQVTAQTIGEKALEKGFTNVRVTVKGLGPGRMAAMKGLTLSGLKVASISDVTPISYYIAPRPRKAKKK